MRDRAADIAVMVEREHQTTTGMSVASGETCRCGYWNGEEIGGVNRPVGLSGLMWHRAQLIADALAAAGLLAGDGPSAADCTDPACRVRDHYVLR